MARAWSAHRTVRTGTFPDRTQHQVAIRVQPGAWQLPASSVAGVR